MSTVPTVPIIRSNCLKQLLELAPPDGNGNGSGNSERRLPLSATSAYFTELEGRIYDACNKPSTYLQIMTSYYRKYTQLYFNLKRHYAYLVERFTPSELVLLDAVELNPQVKQEREHNDEQYRLYKQILSKGIEDNIDDDEDDEDVSNANSNRCRKCKNTKNISIIPRQLRSADEPASLFLLCGACGTQWRIG